MKLINKFFAIAAIFAALGAVMASPAAAHERGGEMLQSSASAYCDTAVSQYSQRVVNPLSQPLEVTMTARHRGERQVVTSVIPAGGTQLFVAVFGPETDEVSLTFVGTAGKTRMREHTHAVC